MTEPDYVGNSERGLLLTGAETARRLSVSRRTLDRIVKAGSLPRYRLRGAIRYAEGDVDRMLDIVEEVAGSAGFCAADPDPEAENG